MHFCILGRALRQGYILGSMRKWFFERKVTIFSHHTLRVIRIVFSMPIYTIWNNLFYFKLSLNYSYNILTTHNIPNNAIYARNWINNTLCLNLLKHITSSFFFQGPMFQFNFLKDDDKLLCFVIPPNETANQLNTVVS